MRTTPFNGRCKEACTEPQHRIKNILVRAPFTFSRGSVFEPLLGNELSDPITKRTFGYSFLYW
jgi:hypothetical protein